MGTCVTLIPLMKKSGMALHFVSWHFHGKPVDKVQHGGTGKKLKISTSPQAQLLLWPPPQIKLRFSFQMIKGFYNLNQCLGLEFIPCDFLLGEITSLLVRTLPWSLEVQGFYSGKSPWWHKKMSSSEDHTWWLEEGRLASEPWPWRAGWPW